MKEDTKVMAHNKKISMILLVFFVSLIILFLTSRSGTTTPKSEDYTAEKLANMSAEELEKLVPDEILKRFSAEELTNMTSDELKHIVPTKFLKKSGGDQKIMPHELIKIPSAENNSD